MIHFKEVHQLAVFVKHYRWTFYLLVFLTFFLGIVAALPPYLIQRTIDDYILPGNYQGLVKMTGVLMALLTIQGTVQYYQTYLSGWLGQHIIRDIRIQLYAHILKLRTRFLDKVPIGRLVTRNISDTEVLADVFSEGMAALIGDLLQMLCMVFLMVYSNWKMALVSLSTLPLMVMITYVFKEKLKHTFKIIRNAVAQLNSFVQEHIIGMHVVQLFNKEQHAMERFKELNKMHQKASIKAVFYYSWYFPMVSATSALGISLLIWYAAQGMLQGTLSFGQLVAFLMYIQLFSHPLHVIADRFNTLQLGIVSIDRILKLLGNGEQMDHQGTYSPKRLAGEVAFQHVWFAYEGAHYVLKDISFHLKAQTSLALVGATGAGKSTIIHLLAQFYQVQKGRITLDGRNINDYALHGLRKHIGLVAQDVFLFSGSIYENITLGNPAITKACVMDATARIGLHDFILQLPGGYDYPIMERGMALSMGQRQLLAFARVLVYDPCILILDEATASMDTASEQLIQKATATLMQQRTCLIIAHRLATIQHADKILVLKEGAIIEQGDHTTLLSQNGHYTALYQAS